MGRTKRLRSKKNKQQHPLSHETNPKIINLKRWMKISNWRNEADLRIKEFPLTGRGVCSRKKINSNSSLIEIPLRILITPKELHIDELINTRGLKTQDLLTIFLVLEKHKAEFFETKWSFYIDSLPATTPDLPWVNMCNKDEKDVLLPKYLKQKLLKCQLKFEESWGRVKKSIMALCCPCCNRRLDGVISLNTFTWGYVMVNTRAVYLEPGVISPKNIDASEILSDDPSIALCPYLDMFNHDASVNTKVEISDEYYKLITLDGFKANEQIFISYGPHDNITLLCEYGFFVPDNENDRIKFEQQEIIVSLNKTGLKIRSEDYRVAKEKFFDELFVNNVGVSFKLKALIYIIHYGCFNWNKIYNEDYSGGEYQAIMSSVEIIINDFRDGLDFFIVNNEGKMLLDYLKYVKKFCDDIVQKNRKIYKF